MKKFSIQEAKAGGCVVTREGESVRILCYDAHTYNYAISSAPIIGLVTTNKGCEKVCRWRPDGRNYRQDRDLFIREAPSGVNPESEGSLE